MSKVATRDRILQAALQVFAEKGYHRALVDDIVQASRTSKGAVYHHFPNKEALFLALVDEFSAHLAESIADAIADAHGALGKVEAALRAGLLTFAHRRRPGATAGTRSPPSSRATSIRPCRRRRSRRSIRAWRPWPGSAPSTRW